MDTEQQRSLASDWYSSNARVKTKKGAPFRGRVISWYYNPVMKHFGVVVMATHHFFAGAVHVYPVTQLELENENT